MNVTIFDYGTGNLHSLRKAIEAAGARASFVRDARSAASADALVLPGVGAFGSATARLADAGVGLRDAIRSGLPTLGICLGMQLLFETSDEGDGRGLGVIPGRVRKMTAPRLPQMGWNNVESNGDPLFDRLPALQAYYANSYVALPTRRESVIAWSDYAGDRFPAAVRAGSAVGVQFHPEKSAEGGLQLIANFLAGAWQ